MNQFRIILALCLVITFIMFPVIAAGQAPTMPHVFFGMVYEGNQTVPAGVVVEATGTGVHNGTTGNPVSTKADGAYGGPGSYDQKLIVQGEISNGGLVSFYVNSEKAQCRVSGIDGAWGDTYPFKSAEKTNLDLMVTTLPTGTTTIPPTTETTTITITPTHTSTPYSGSSGGGGGGGGGGGSFAGSVASGSTSATETTRITTISTPAQTLGGNVGSTSIPEINPVTRVSITESPTKQAAATSPGSTQAPAAPGSSLTLIIIGVFVIAGIIAAIVVIVVLIRKGHM